MKKTPLISLVGIFFLLLTAPGCREIPGSYKAYFWTNAGTNNTKSLYIDDEYKGELPYKSNAPGMPGDTIKKDTRLLVNLQSGRYKLLVKDAKGAIVSKGTLSLKKTTNSNNVRISWNNDRCQAEVISLN